MINNNMLSEKMLKLNLIWALILIFERLGGRASQWLVSVDILKTATPISILYYIYMLIMDIVLLWIYGTQLVSKLKTPLIS